MKLVILTTPLLLAVSTLVLAATDPAAQQLLVAAEQQANIFQHDASPFQLELDFTAHVQVPTQGHLTLKWEADDRWWRKIVLANFQQIDIRSGDKLYTSRNAPFTPIRVGDLVNLILFTDKPEKLKLKKQKQRVDNGKEVSCLQVQKDKGIPNEPNDLCIDSSSHEIVSNERKERPDRQQRQQFSDYFEFRGYRWPRKFELFEDGSKVITAQVNSLTTAPLDQALLVPPQGAIERRQCEGMKHAIPVKTPDPTYPKSASQNGLIGDTTVAMTVLADGSLSDIQLVGRAAQSMDEATLKTLQSWRFKPAMCGDEPVVSDIHVVVSFRLR